MLCESLVLSQFNYCDVIYGPCIKSTEVRRIQKMQNSCLRLIHGIRKFDRITHTLYQTKWLNMCNRRKLHSATIFFNIIKTQQPSYLHCKIRFRTDVHNLNIRFKGTLTPPLHSTRLFQRSYSYQIAYNINNLSRDYKTINSKKAFKKELFRFLFLNQL